MFQSKIALHRLLLGAMLLFGLSSSNAAAINRFLPLGDLSGGRFESGADAISADGRVIVGHSSIDVVNEFPIYGAFRWTFETGMNGLGKLPGGQPNSNATGVSADGKVIAGFSGSSNSSCCSEAFRWEESTGMVGLGVIGPQSFAQDISADGKTIVGEAATLLAFRAKYPGGAATIGDIPGGVDFSYATAVSADGSVIVGRGNSVRGPEAFRWTEADGFVGLGDLSDPILFSVARGISDNGLVIVGEATKSTHDPSGQFLSQAFRWTAETGMVGIGPEPTILWTSQALDASADGSVIVGTAGPYTNLAFVWTEARGMLMLDELLTNAGVDLTNWQLNQVTSVSADGNIVAGVGVNPDGKSEAFRADLTGLLSVPECSSFLLAVLCGTPIGLGRRLRTK